MPDSPRRPGSSPGSPASPGRIPRTTARVLPVAPDGAVLLLQEQDPSHPGIPWWGTVGGAVDPGESLVEVAVRELVEETGIVVAAESLVGPVAVGDYEFSFAGVDYLSHTHFFAMASDRDVEVSFDHLEPDEIGNVLSWAWWLPGDLEAEGTAVQPDLPEVMRRAAVAVQEAR